MADDAPAFAGDTPQYYDRDVGPVLFVDYADDLARRVAALSPGRVLETAAGTGIVTRRLRDRLPAGSRLVATDISPPMLDVAKAKFAGGETVEFQQADATALPFEDASFDAVVCQFGIMFFPDKAKSYREVRRVLAPGGRYLFSVWDSHAHNPYARLTHELIGSYFSADPPRFYEMPFAFAAIDPVKEALSAAGFGDLRVAVLSRVAEVPDIGPFAHAFVYGTPIAEQIAARGGGVDLAAMAGALDAALRREFGDRPSRVPMQAIVFEATRR